MFAEEVRDYIQGDERLFTEACRNVYAKFMAEGREDQVAQGVREDLERARVDLETESMTAGGVEDHGIEGLFRVIVEHGVISEGAATSLLRQMSIY